MPRYKIIIEYKGTNYVGWQRQDNGPSIQSEIENSIKKLVGKKIEVFGAGRTDAGVHALKQIAHFDLEKFFPVDVIRDGLNQYLRPQAISIIKAEKVSENFHARFNAKQRYYSYIIINRRSPLTIERNRAWVVHKKLNVILMQQAIKLFIGKHNFNAFRSVNCQSETSFKTIDYAEVKENNKKIIIDVKAKSFLHSQVRIMVGTIVYVGEGKIKFDQITSIIRSGDRKKAGPTAPAEGLYLKDIIY